MAIYILMRKLHRIFVPVIIFLALVMALTGIQMKYYIGDEGLARYIHNNVSIIFTIVLAVMIISGACLYLYPWISKRLGKSPKN